MKNKLLAILITLALVGSLFVVACNQEQAQPKAGLGQTVFTRLMVNGEDDSEQLVVQGHSTQVSNILVVENSAGTDKFTVSNAGVVTAASNIVGQGTLTLSGVGTVNNNLVVTGTSDLQGNVADSGGDLTVADNVVVTGTSDLQGNISDSSGSLTVADDLVVTGTIDLTGDVLFRATDLTINRNVVVTGTLDVQNGSIANADLVAPNALFAVPVAYGSAITNTATAQVFVFKVPVASTGVSASVSYQGVTGDTGTITLSIGDDTVEVGTIAQADPANNTLYYASSFTNVFAANSVVTVTVNAPSGKGVTGVQAMLWMKAAHQ